MWVSGPWGCGLRLKLKSPRDEDVDERFSSRVY